MDAFYASVEQRDNPELLGQPIVVGGRSQERGVVAAASYEARQYGIRSAMPSSTAERLCPDLIFVPMRMSYYVEVSNQIREIFDRYTPLVEPLSIDEAFLDVSGSTRLWGDATTIAKRIKREILDELHLTASVGIAPNKFVAKIASDLQKPDGFVRVDPPLDLFLDPLPINRLWGIGRVTEQKLKSAGIFTIRNFRRTNPEFLRQFVGNSTEHLLQLARGEDPRKVEPYRESVSISTETTFSVDVEDFDYLENTMLGLTEKIVARLRTKKLRARTVGIKLRDSNFKTLSRNLTLPDATDVTQVIWKSVQKLLRKTLDGQFKIRLIGVQISSLESAADNNQSLLDFNDVERQKKIDGVMDDVNRKFGAGALHRGVDRSI